MAAESNHLIGEKSPYLLQHARNPVDWYPWGKEAFAKARQEQKPIFLSIGYSTCHWCHVMERESFENPEIAALMNKYFVNIKVDREERPDIDRVYMAFVQATTGGGGWPMSVFLTPELKPFVGGTYFPPTAKGGHPGFPDVLKQIARAWEEDRPRILESSEQVMAALQQATATSPRESGLPVEAIPRCYDQLAAGFDEREGGFGGAPKFPRPVSLEFLFRVHAAHPETKKGKRALEMTLLTLRKMAAGGMHDQIGGGFHRYSVDGRWHVPHFEKMLYDQAQLANAYISAFQITHESQYAAIARDILDYVLRDLSHKDGAFYTAEDADSPLQADRPEHAEGAFYVWTEQELIDALGAEEANKFIVAYGVKSDGNVPASADPHGELEGKNVLVAAGVTSDLATVRQTLFDLRAKRPRPHLDDKILTSWNGLIISALARAGAVLHEPKYVETAIKAARFIRQNLTKEGRLLRSYREGGSEVRGFADDYAFLIEGLLDLYDASADAAWLTWAGELQEAQDKLFLDPKAGGYFMTAGDDPSVLLRMKEDYDGAEPSPNSVSARNLARLAVLLDRPAYRDRAESTVAAFHTQILNTPTALPLMLAAVDFLADKPRQIVLTGPFDSPLRTTIRKLYLPNTVLLYPSAPNPFLQSMTAIDAKPTAYVCEDFVCQLPVTTVPELERLLAPQR